MTEILVAVLAGVGGYVVVSIFIAALFRSHTLRDLNDRWWNFLLRIAGYKKDSP